MNLQELERPFDAHLIKTRKGMNGKTLSYVPSAEYVRRLNQASADGAWDFEILEHHILEDEVIVLGKLTIDGTTKTEFGGSSITRSRNDGSRVSLASDLKAASSDALKRCSMRLGLGLHLYTGATASPASNAPPGSTSPQGSPASSSTRSPSPPQSTAQPIRQAPKPHRNRTDASTAYPSTATPKQLSAIWSMSRDLRCSPEKMRVRCQETFGKPPEGLSKAEASSFISKLAEELDANRRRQQEFDRSRGAA